MTSPHLQQVVQCIISGGQTGVDRGALDAAIELGIDHGGYCPRGRIAEDGKIPRRYQLTENESVEYWVRTEQNVQLADGTLILYRDQLSGGTEFTRRMALKHRKAHLVVPLAQEADALVVRRWITDNRIERLNVAGPRESLCPGIAVETRRFLLAVFATAGGI